VGKSSNHSQETCPSLGRVQAYLDDLLSESEKTDFENHLPDCAACKHALEKYRQVSGLLQETAAEPLPALDRDRVYERAVAGRQPLGWLIPAAAAVAAALLLFVLWPRTGPVSTYARAPGAIEPSAPAAPLQAAITYMSADASGPGQTRGGFVLTEGAEARAGLAGAIALRVTDGVSVVLLAGGRATIKHGPDGSLRVSLTAGELVARLRRPLERRFVVETPAGSIEATGTIFVGRIQKDGNTEVWLYEGRVRIHPRQGISHERGANAHAVFSSKALERVDQDVSGGREVLADAQRMDPLGPGSLSWVSIISEPEGAEVTAGEVILGYTPLLMAREAGRLDLAIAMDGYETDRESVELVSGRLSSYEIELVPATAPASDPLGRIRRLLAARRIEQAVRELDGYLEKKPGDVKATFLLADARRLGKKPKEALALYQQVGDTAWDHRLREAALYEVGRLQLHALSKPEEALQTFLKLKKEYPRGLLGQEVAYHLAESYIAAKRFSEAVRALEDYLESYPQGTKAKDARTLLDALKTKGWR
jgi:ferric-dicitrate binding protein FerR (iron transport regulator)